MTENTINLLITKKFKHFLKSIDDNDIRTLFVKDSFVTGGCITSMLLNEEINDFDIYFKNLESLKKVAKYFIKKYLEENPNIQVKPDVIERQDSIKIKIQSKGFTSEQTEENKSTTYRYFEDPTYSDEQEEYLYDNITNIINELDDADAILVKEVEDKILKDKPRKTRKPYIPIFITDNAISLSGKVQITLRFYGEPEEIFKNFDFVHCTNYWNPMDQKCYFNKEALLSVLTKKLKYVGSRYPICSVIRTRKFTKRGWNISAGDYLKMILQIKDLDLDNTDVLQDQLMGVDTAYFSQLINWLKEIQENNLDPNKEKIEVNTPYIISLIDKIF